MAIKGCWKAVTAVCVIAMFFNQVGSQFLIKGKVKNDIKTFKRQILTVRIFIVSGRPQFRIRNLDDLISVGIESLFPEEILSDEQMRDSVKFRLYHDLK